MFSKSEEQNEDHESFSSFKQINELRIQKNHPRSSEV